MILDIDYLTDNRNSEAISSMVRWPKDLEVLFISQWSIAAQKVGKPIQEAIKGVATVAGIASHHMHAKVMSYIPRRRDLSEEEANHAINKPKQQATRGVSKVARVICAMLSSKQPKLSSKMEKGVKVMDKVNKVSMGYVPGRHDLSELEAFQQRDISEAYSSFEERYDIALENREAYFEANERDIYECYDLD